MNNKLNPLIFSFIVFLLDKQLRIKISFFFRKTFVRFNIKTVKFRGKYRTEPQIIGL